MKAQVSGNDIHVFIGMLQQFPQKHAPAGGHVQQKARFQLGDLLHDAIEEVLLYLPLAVCLLRFQLFAEGIVAIFINVILPGIESVLLL